MLQKISANEKADDCVILLHGYGANMHDLWGMKGIFPGKCVISLQAPLMLEWGGNSWFDIDFTPFGAEYDVLGLEKAVLVVKKFLEGVSKKYKKVWLCGFSQGAIISHAILLRYPQLIEGAACLSGRFVESIFTKKERRLIQKKHLFVSHGTVDQVISYEKGGKAINSYYQGTDAMVSFHKYRMGHEIIPECQVDLKEWFNRVN